MQIGQSDDQGNSLTWLWSGEELSFQTGFSLVIASPAWLGISVWDKTQVFDNAVCTFLSSATKPVLMLLMFLVISFILSAVITIRIMLSATFVPGGPSLLLAYYCRYKKIHSWKVSVPKMSYRHKMSATLSLLEPMQLPSFFYELFCIYITKIKSVNSSPPLGVTM